MISLRQRMFWAGLLASASFAVAAQTPPAPAAPPAAEAQAGAQQPQRRMDRGDPARFAERMQQRRAAHLAQLKDKLKLSPAQEGAWSSFSAATQPPARPPQRPDRAEFDQLSTPERLDRMQARQAERSAMFARHADATRSFYAALTPEQQKTFDAETLRHGPRGHGMHHGMHHGGPDGQRPPPAAPKG
jgi:LTXXQ motif family protein